LFYILWRVAMKVLFLTLAMISLVFNLHAQEEKKETEKKEEKIIEMEDYEVVVTGRKREEKQFDANRAISSVKSEEIRKEAKGTLPDAIDNVEGAFVQKTNTGGGSPILRGLIGPQVLITIDGVRFNNSVYRTGPVQYLNLIDPYSLEKIEVMKGPGSVLYGSDAMGGVINLSPVSPSQFRKTEDFDYAANLFGKFGSADLSGVGHAHGGIGYKGFGAKAGVTYKYFNSLKSGGDPWKGKVDGLKKGEQPWTGYDNLSLFSNLEYNFPGMKGWRVSAVYLHSRIDDAGRTDRVLNQQGEIASKPSLTVYDNTSHFAYARLNMNISPLSTKGEATFSYHNFFERADSLPLDRENLNKRMSVSRDEVTVDTIGADLKFQTSLLKGFWNLNYGGSYYHDMIDSLRKTDSENSGIFTKSDATPYPEGSTYSNFGLYLYNELTLWYRDKQSAALDFGYRFHGFRGAAPEKGDLEKVDISNYGHVFSASLQYLYEEKVNVAFSFSQGFRAPNFNEAVLLGDTGKFFHIPNSDLDPEYSNTFELLLNLKNEKAFVGGAAYITLIEDVIIREHSTWNGESEYSGKPVAQNVNGNDAKIFGIEGNTGVELPAGFFVSGKGSYVKGWKTIDSGTVPYTRIPPLMGEVKLRWNAPEFYRTKTYIETFIRGADRQDRLSPEDISDNRIPEDGTPAWWTLNFRAGANFKENYKLNLSFENVLNRQYKYHASGIYAPGFNFSASLDIDI
jgi:hemoglobin/transferrin/lactoferrin receptor protein